MMSQREIVGPQERFERSGAQNAREPRDEPLSARPALAVAILFSFAHQAKVRRRWREQEIPAAIMGRLINGRWKAGGSGTSADRGRVGARHHHLDDAVRRKGRRD